MQQRYTYVVIQKLHYTALSRSRITLIRLSQQHYTNFHSSITLSYICRSSIIQSTDAVLHRAQTQHYTEHKSSITQSRITYLRSSFTPRTDAALSRAQTQHTKTALHKAELNAAALYLIIQRQHYTERRCRITQNTKADYMEQDYT